MQATLENALSILEKATARLFYKKYRGAIRDFDQFYSDAQMMVFSKFAKYDEAIGTFEGYINSCVEYAAIRIVCDTRKTKVHVGTIAEAVRHEAEVPEEFNFIVSMALEFSKTMKRTDSVRNAVRAELRKQGWGPSRIDAAFAAIDDAVTGDTVRSYAKVGDE